MFLLRRLVERVKELVALGYGYLQSLVRFLARLVRKGEPPSTPVRHNASILSPESVSSQYNHELKLERAREHLQSLNAEIREWLEGNTYRYVPKLDSQSGKKRIYFEVLQAR